MEKLISMTDFVFGEANKKVKINEVTLETLAKSANKIYKYAKFLKTPLTLGIFIPVDEAGNVLEKYHDLDNKNILYNEAKEKILFEGFIPDLREITGTIYFDSLEIDRTELIIYRPGINFTNSQGKVIKTIEDLCSIKGLKLTETAKKQIGLDLEQNPYA